MAPPEKWATRGRKLSRKRATCKLVGATDVNDDLKAAIAGSKPDVVVDFTHPSVVMANVRKILESKVHAVVGTTGLTEKDLEEIKELCEKNKVNCIVAPNFAIGAVLMMIFSRTAAKFMPNVEIIELHHDKKADSPSGTAMKTAEMILQSEAAKGLIKGKKSEIENLEGARGGSLGGIHIHSVRLPGFVASQEVIFGGLGQTLTIRHDTDIPRILHARRDNGGQEDRESERPDLRAREPPVLMPRYKKVLAENRKAFFDYAIIESYQAGIALKGGEVKSVRLGHANLKDSFARVEKGELWLYNMHIAPYEQGGRYNLEPTRQRKLLLHKNEMKKLIGRVQEKGLTLIPLKIYLMGNWVKVDLALAKSKKMFEKRESIKKKETQREIARALLG